MDKFENDASRKAARCRWCESELNPSDSNSADEVCQKCYRLLLNAGIPEEEILSGRDRRRAPRKIIKDVIYSGIWVFSAALFN